MDGSTDCGTVEQETMFIRCCHDGKIELKFLCIGEPRSTCAKDLLTFVREKIDENQLADHMHKFMDSGVMGPQTCLGVLMALFPFSKRIM